MYIESVGLKNFRNIENLKLDFKPGINILHGNNAQGKTNILEAIFLCATGRSHRTHNDRELIKFFKQDLFVKLTVNNNGRTNIIDVYLKDKKGIAINSIPIKKLVDLFGILHVVIFSPEDLDIIKTGPSIRRKFMDLQLSQLSKVYFYNLQQYHKVLKQRNILLKKMTKADSELSVWDNQLIKFGMKIISERKNFVKKLSSLANERHKIITGGTEDLNVSYIPNCQADDFLMRLNKNVERDIFLGTTSVGPHKDDINFFINGHDVKSFGSQGQLRCAALSAKMSEIDLIINETGDTPVLLLDDVFSELDEKRARFLLSDFKDIQIIITCTGVENVLMDFMDYSKDFNVFYIENGNKICYNNIKN